MEIEIVPKEKEEKEIITWKIIFIHTALWTLWTLYDYLINLIGDPANPASPIVFIFSHLLLAAFFYANALWIFPAFYPTKKYFILFLADIGIVASYIALRLGIRVLVMPLFGIHFPPVTFNYDFWFNSFYSAQQYFIFSMAYFFMREAIRVEKLRAATERKLNLTELQFLRAQINPHFLYNTLNYLYLQAKNVSPQMGEAVLQLANLMRMSIRPKGNYSNLVDLGKELDYLEAFIEMQQMRFGRSLNVVFEREGEFEGKLFVPMVLVSFVENAFKHGELSDPENPVVFEAICHDNNFEFNTYNNKNTDIREFSSGIGFENIRSRLNILYPNRFTLKIEQTDLEFSANLKVKLDDR